MYINSIFRGKGRTGLCLLSFVVMFENLLFVQRYYLEEFYRIIQQFNYNGIYMSSSAWLQHPQYAVLSIGCTRVLRTTTTTTRIYPYPAGRRS